MLFRSELQRDQPDANTNWQVTSDSIALDLARRMNAERLVVVKSCEIDPTANLAALTAAGVLDQRFEAMAEDAAFPINIVHHSELGRMRALLLGMLRYIDA